MNNDIKNIELVVAVRNEAKILPSFVNEISRIDIAGVKLCTLFIEDGSTDNTVEILKELCYNTKDINYYSIINPFGQGLALSYGLLKSDADAVITMDVDGSHTVETAERMILKYLEGFSIVQGNRIAYDRKNLYRKVGSKIYFVLFTFFTGVNLYRQNVHFRLMDRETIDRYRKSERSWFSARLKKSITRNKKTCFVEFIAPERKIGISKFNFKRLVGIAYRSFLTLTGLPMFIFLNSFVVIFIYLGYTLISWVIPTIILVLAMVNAVAYLRVNKGQYLKKISLHDSSFSYNNKNI